MGCGSSTPEVNTQGDGQSLLASGSDQGHKYNMKGTSGGAKAPTEAPKAAKKKKGPSKSKPVAPPPQQQSPSKMPSTAKPFNRAVDRIDAIDKSRTIQCGGIKMTYAYLSQRGFYPEEPFKANQDAYCVRPEVVKGKEDAFFGVFDGHGKDGDGCAIYAKSNLHPNLSTILSKTKPRNSNKSKELGREQVQTALLRAHVETNKGLHKNQKIDDSLSGTTAISVYFHGGARNRITISNVGDSRAVVGTEAPPQGGSPSQRNSNNRRNTLRAYPLSRDQTPYRKDERARVKAAGARVLSLDQLEGLEPIIEGASEAEGDDFELGEELDEGGDPPRVWSQDGDYPGTAFTRSIGDSVAEDLGVFAEPEMLTREVVKDDKIIVLASDGVFEFLTNQSVIDICAKFTDPLEACRAVVAEAYELWLQYELRTDDITIICIFVDEVQGDSGRRTELGHGEVANTSGRNLTVVQNSSAVSDDDVDNATLATEGIRPVRKHASKEKSKAIAKLKELGKTLHNADDDALFNWKEHATDKTEDEKRSIEDAIRASVMFRNTTEEQREMIYACMESVDVKAGTWVIQQGTVGDRFYIVDEGQFEVRIVPDGEEDETGQGGHIVHIYEGSREKHAHPSFGELALVRGPLCRYLWVLVPSDSHDSRKSFFTGP